MSALWMLAWLVAWAAPARIVLDDATADQLAALPAMSEALAASVVELRAQRGHLGSVEELRILPTMTPAALDSLRANTSVRVALTSGPDRTLTSVADVLASFDHEPKVEEVQRWASEYAKVQPELVDRWLAASRGFAALPQLRVSYGLDDNYDNDFDYYDEFGLPPTSDDTPTTDVQTAASVGQRRSIDVVATWDLDKIVMSSEQIRVINEAQDIVKLREKVLGEVTRLYFERRRLQVDVLLNPKVDLAGQVKDELRLRELTANLDAYTGGRFSAAVAGGPAR
ncbi:MAG TPA: helix-hairpin-helix domain-containing protein [Myxococcota bacterium]|nr:helix-hairpin-helix domain-containing protein [Myxococcota bacterium]